MARTSLTTDQLYRLDRGDTRELMRAKLAEHDTAHDSHEDAIAALQAFLNGTIDFKQSCRVATTANHALSGLTAINGVTPVAGNRILVRAQSAPAENGIYVAAAGAWARASDANTSAEMTAGLFVFVSEGTADPNSWYQLTTADPIALGTTELAFTKLPTLAELASTDNGKGADLIGSDAAGFTATTVSGQLAEVKALVDADLLLAQRTVTVDESELTGTSQAVNVGLALPAGAIVLGHQIKVNEQAADQSDLTIKLGGTDTDAIVAATDLDALAPGLYSGTLGVHPRGEFSEEQLVATFAATDLAALTAGNWTITVWYRLLP